MATDPLAPLLNFIQTPPGMIALVGVGVAIGFYFMRKHYQEKQYDGINLTSVVRDEMMEIIEKSGAKVSKKFDKDAANIGVIMKREKADVNPSKRDKENKPESEDAKEVTMYRFTVRKNKIIWKILMKLKPIRKRKADIYVVHEDNFTEDVDRVEVHPHVSFRKLGGIFIDNTEAALEHGKSFVWSEVLNDDLERTTNFIRYFTWRERNNAAGFVQDELRNKLKQEMFDRRERGKVEKP